MSSLVLLVQLLHMTRTQQRFPWTHVLKTNYVASSLITVLTWKPTYRQALQGLKHSGIETADTLFSLFLCQACTRTSHVRQYESADIVLETWHSSKMRICITENLKSVLRGEHFKCPRFSICTLIHIYTWNDHSFSVGLKNIMFIPSVLRSENFKCPQFLYEERHVIPSILRSGHFECSQFQYKEHHVQPSCSSVLRGEQIKWPQFL